MAESTWKARAAKWGIPALIFGCCMTAAQARFPHLVGGAFNGFILLLFAYVTVGVLRLPGIEQRILTVHRRFKDRRLMSYSIVIVGFGFLGSIYWTIICKVSDTLANKENTVSQAPNEDGDTQSLFVTGLSSSAIVTNPFTVVLKARNASAGEITLVRAWLKPQISIPNYPIPFPEYDFSNLSMIGTRLKGGQAFQQSFMLPPLPKDYFDNFQANKFILFVFGWMEYTNKTGRLFRVRFLFQYGKVPEPQFSLVNDPRSTAFDTDIPIPVPVRIEANYMGFPASSPPEGADILSVNAMEKLGSFNRRIWHSKKDAVTILPSFAWPNQCVQYRVINFGKVPLLDIHFTFNIDFYVPSNPITRAGKEVVNSKTSKSIYVSSLDVGSQNAYTFYAIKEDSRTANVKLPLRGYATNASGQLTELIVSPEDPMGQWFVQMDAPPKPPRAAKGNRPRSKG